MTKNDQNDQKWYGLDKDVAKKTIFNLEGPVAKYHQLD